MEVRPDNLPDFVRQRMLHVEDELLRNRDRNRDRNQRLCILEEIAIDSAKRFPILPLIESITHLRGITRPHGIAHPHDPSPGVYLIYYVGNTSLYKGRVNSSRNHPIYVGMSRTSILSRLTNFRWKVSKAENEFKLEDFEVRIIFVDIIHYALAIESALLKHCSPLWNDGEVDFRFGNAESDNNNWNRYHVQNDSSEDFIKSMDDRVAWWSSEKIPLLAHWFETRP